ncbi:MAG: SDR family NAD(P)-dependent oxidoreductase [Myxococcota bacterium]
MKTIVLTGGNRGLGRATVEQLARRGHRVVLTARDVAAGEAVAKACGPNVSVRALDLSSLESVRRFARELLAEDVHLDVLFHNAGVMQQSPTRRTTKDGFEETLGVNVLAPFLLTRLLEPALERSKARVVFVSSRLHKPGTRGKGAEFDFDDPQLERGYSPDRAYKNSKLAMLWVAFELDRRLAGRGVRVNGVCPGFVPATAAESTAGLKKWFMKHVLVHAPFAASVEQAVDSFCFMALDPSLEGVGGRFYGEQQALEPSADARDEAKAKRFWEYASGLVGA